MEFRKASINGQLYGKIFQGTAQNEAKDEAQAKMKSVLSKLFDTSGASPSYSFVDIKIAEDLFAGNVQAFKIREFFTLLAVCHTVLLENTGNPENPRVYNAQSPDEAALVTTAKDIGFEFISRSHKSIEVVVIGEKRTYSILNIMEFNSDRKRMSLIVQRPEGEIILLCKGADSVIYERLSDDNDEELLSKTMDHLGKFANEGLRTLCLAYRIISESEYRSWADKYKQAQALITERDAECDKLADLIERDLILMGATAIEDKLQDDVPQSISLLHKAGIKIWVLTGDKLETAINIGFSCNLLKKSMVLIVIKAESSIDAQNQIQEALSRFWNESGIPRNEQTMSLIIDGDSLKYGLDDYCKPYLLELGCRCKTVICCRVTPLQKAMVVQMVRSGLVSIFNLGSHVFGYRRWS
jgi:phospholipid-translocating ATPase